MADNFEDVQDALDEVAKGRISAERVRDEYGHVDGIGRSIAAAVAKREEYLDDDEW